MTTIKKYKPSPDAIYSSIDNEVVIMSLSQDQYISLNEVASVIWELISEQPHTLDELTEKLLAEYEVDETTCRKEVEAFIKELEEKGLVEGVRSEE